MNTRWYIDDHSIEVELGAREQTIAIDESVVSKIPNNVLARFVIPWRDRDVELRRTRNLDTVRSELWIDGRPSAPNTRGARPAKEGAKCSTHDESASIQCTDCDAELCPRCGSPDGCRCPTCYDKAGRELAGKVQRQRLLGVGFGVVLAVLGVIAGYRYGIEILIQGGAGLLGLMLFLVIGGIYRERKERGRLELVGLPIDLEALDEPKQVVGTPCSVCEKRITMAKDEGWCPTCQTAFHAKCSGEHSCTRAETGPDWWGMRAEMEN